MKLSKSLLLLFCISGVSYGSSLDVYKDRSVYRYNAQKSFIGFASNISAKCKTDSVSLIQSQACPEEERLCKLYYQLKFMEEKKQATDANLKNLQQLLTLPKPDSINGQALIEAAKLTAEEQSRLLTLSNKLARDITIQERIFRKQAPTNSALNLEKTCEDELEVSIPEGIVFSTRYEANLIDDKKIDVTQFLSVRNRSGIDIDADTAHFYYRTAHQYVYPVHFSPWIVSKYQPPIAKRKMFKSAARMAEPTMEMAMADSAPLPTVATYEDSREYKVTNLNLPSSGEVVEKKLISYQTKLKCDIKAYPYESTSALHVCSFKPKYQIDANKWNINNKGVLLNEHATGEYKDERYDLYTMIDEDIKIRRRPIVQRERESGIFGSSIRKKDGFNILITNKSDKEKTLTIIDRIPTSATDEINAKLLSVESENKVDYAVQEDGKIEMHLTLAPNEHKKIEVMFELSYDKDLKVNY